MQGQLTRQCSKCKEFKPVSRFSQNPRTNGRQRLHSWCRDCMNKATRIHNKTPEGKAAWRRHYFKRNYGITLEQYDRAICEQRGVCAICGKPEKVIRSKSGIPFSLAVDHDHSTGKFRALLCSSCNRGIAAFLDDPDLLQKAINYLQKHSTKLDS